MSSVTQHPELKREMLARCSIQRHVIARKTCPGCGTHLLASEVMCPDCRAFQRMFEVFRDRT